MVNSERIMKYFDYLKQHGIRYVIKIIYQYKIDELLQKIILPFVKGKISNTIVLEGHDDFDSNAGAFYSYLIEHKLNKKYKIVWLLKNSIPKHLPENVVAFYLRKPSLRKSIQLCTAKYILTCNNIIGSFQEGQTTIYLSHGPVSLKSVKGKALLPINLTNVLMPSTFLTPILKDIYGLEGNKNTKTVILGYPSHDLLYKKSNELKKITTRNFSKVILWMPTFRKLKNSSRNDSSVSSNLGIPLFKSQKELEKLNESLLINNALLLVKIHPMQDLSDFMAKGCSNIIFLTGADVRNLKVDNYRLMANVDALISDYSSAAYDFLHCDKPIAYTMDDENDYKLDFIVDDPKELIAGKVIYNLNDFQEFILSVVNEEDPYVDIRHTVFDKVFKFHDGNSSRRLADFLKL